MNIAIDIDDTLTESFSYFIPFVGECRWDEKSDG